MVRMIRLRVMMIISYLALLFGYYVKKKHRGSYAYFVELGNCLFSSSTNWVIDSDASDHTTGNSYIFNNFDTHTSSSHVTIVDGSISQVLGSGTINLSPSISLSSVLSLPKFSFNLLSVSRITSNLQCSVKFYPEYYVFKDLKTKKIIGRGQKCDGLYVFEPEVSKSLVGLSSSSPFEAHCRLGHPSLQSLKKLCPEYSHLSSLNSDSYVTFHEDLPYFPVTTYHHQEENDDLLVYVSPTPVEITKQSAEPDDAPIDLPNDAPNNVSNDVPTPSDTYNDSDAPSDALGGFDSPPASPSGFDAPSDVLGGSDSPPASPAPELDIPIALQNGKRTCTYPVSSFGLY
ncbi:hypothetical protein Tco_0572733 [Tanacetum coccineum]